MTVTEQLNALAAKLGWFSIRPRFGDYTGTHGNHSGWVITVKADANSVPTDYGDSTFEGVVQLVYGRFVTTEPPGRTIKIKGSKR